MREKKEKKVKKEGFLRLSVHTSEMNVTSDAGDRGSNIIAGASLVCFRRRKL